MSTSTEARLPPIDRPASLLLRLAYRAAARQFGKVILQVAGEVDADLIIVGEQGPRHGEVVAVVPGPLRMLSVVAVTRSCTAAGWLLSGVANLALIQPLLPLGS